MAVESIDEWLDHNLPNFQNLTAAVISITRNLLAAEKIDVLSTDGRTKTISGCKEKIKRKGYTDPSTQLTDVSGIRIIVYFEHDIPRVSDIIERSFNVDKANSLNKDSLLSTNQIGYRSIHYVCDIGDDRSVLPEFKNLSGLKFEFQIRTVLQHAWAELAHDRNYKFSGKLPREIERKLFLYAGMLEIADGGFSELSKEIDAYIRQVSNATEVGNLDIEVNSLSIQEYIKHWSKINNYELHHIPYIQYDDLVNELNQFGVSKLSELEAIIPADFVKISKDSKISTTIHGVVRDWMMISDAKKFAKNVKVLWAMSENDLDFLAKFISKADLRLLRSSIRIDSQLDRDYDFPDDGPDDVGA